MLKHLILPVLIAVAVATPISTASAMGDTDWKATEFVYQNDDGSWTATVAHWTEDGEFESRGVTRKSKRKAKKAAKIAAEVLNDDEVVDPCFFDPANCNF